MQRSSVSSILFALKECGNARDLQHGKTIHGDAIQTGVAADVFVATTLVSMYAKCGSMAEARKVFDGMPSRNLVSWTALMLGYAQNGQSEMALALFQQLQRFHGSSLLDRSALLAALKACSNLAATKQDCESLRRSCLEKGIEIHHLAAKNGLQDDIFVATSLVDMYVKCGNLVDALRVFQAIPRNNVVSWTAMIFAYVQNGEFKLGLELFARMQLEGCKPGAQSFVAAIKACSGLAAKEQGQKEKFVVRKKGSVIHHQAASDGCDKVIFVATSLVEMYLKCGSLVDARRVFDGIPRNNVISWTTLMLGYVQNGEANMALKLFASMQQEGCSPDAKTFVTALQACATLAEEVEDKQIAKKESFKCLLLRKGTTIHFQAACAGFDSDVFLTSSLIDMYAKCGSMVRAQKVFSKMKCHDVVSWTALILGYAQNGDGEQALQLFQKFLETESFNCEANTQSFVAALKACTSLTAVEEPRQADGKLLKLRSLERGMALHAQATRKGYDSDLFVASSLVDLYAKCGSLEDAGRVFKRMERHNLVTWNAMLLACVHNGEAKVALHLFACIDFEGYLPDTRAFTAALKACSSLGALEKGRSLHYELCTTGLIGETVVANCLVDFYGKCGSMSEAEQVFNTVSRRDVVTWTSLLTGYSRQGETERVFDLFRGLRDDGLHPNKVTLLAVLAACSHAGLVERGKELFGSMTSKYGIVPELEHYHCVIDMLGRANQLEEAVAMVTSMPYRANEVTWTSVLGACWKWKNVEVGRVAFEALVRLNGSHAAAYDLMANIYESVGMLQEMRAIKIQHGMLLLDP